MTTASAAGLSFGSAATHRNLSTPALIEMAIRRGEGTLAANGALNVDTGDRTGRSPNDKFLEDTPDIHDSIHWGKVNRPITPEAFAELEQLGRDHLSSKADLFQFDGYAGADADYRLKVSVVTEKAWHCLFVKTLFINAPADALRGFEPDWIVLNACGHSIDDPARYGLNSSVATRSTGLKATVSSIWPFRRRRSRRSCVSSRPRA